MSEWQDISTAPKDGTRILLWSKRKSSRAGAVDFNERNWDYDAAPEAWQADYSHGIWQTGNFHLFHEPTHWQPLPAPPEQ